MSSIPERVRGNDISWSLPLLDGTSPVYLNTLVDYQIDLFYYVGQERKKWLTYKKTPTGSEKQIYEENANTMKIVIDHVASATAPLAIIFAQVKVVQSNTSGPYPSNQNWNPVLDNTTGKDEHLICKMIGGAQ